MKNGRKYVAELLERLNSLEREVTELNFRNRALQALYDCATGAAEELPPDVRTFVTGLPENTDLPKGTQPWQVLGAVCA